MAKASKTNKATVTSTPSAPAQATKHLVANPEAKVHSIEELLISLRNETDASKKKMIRRRLRSMGHWGGKKYVEFVGDTVKRDVKAIDALAARHASMNEHATALKAKATA